MATVLIINPKKNENEKGTKAYEPAFIINTSEKTVGEAILFGLVARSEAIINVDEDILLSDLTNKYLSIRSGIYLGMGWII